MPTAKPVDQLGDILHHFLDRLLTGVRGFLSLEMLSDALKGSPAESFKKPGNNV
jgi:hypothetical protein